jgi:hypothetical protein
MDLARQTAAIVFFSPLVFRVIRRYIFKGIAEADD